MKILEKKKKNKARISSARISSLATAHVQKNALMEPAFIGDQWRAFYCHRRSRRRLPCYFGFPAEKCYREERLRQ